MDGSLSQAPMDSPSSTENKWLWLGDPFNNFSVRSLFKNLTLSHETHERSPTSTRQNLEGETLQEDQVYLLRINL